RRMSTPYATIKCAIKRRQEQHKILHLLPRPKIEWSRHAFADCITGQITITRHRSRSSFHWNAVVGLAPCHYTPHHEPTVSDKIDAYRVMIVRRWRSNGVTTQADSV